MRTARLLVTSILTIAPILAASQSSTESVALAFEKLQSQSPTEIKQASEQLLRLGKSDPKARDYIALHLPPLIEKGPKDYLGRWITFVRLAGELKIAEAAPALAKWLTIDNIGEISTAGFMRLENNPAGAALVQIGDLAIPAVTTVFDHGTLRERRYAVYVLIQINSPSAKRALREQLNHEADEDLRDFIRKSLGS
jgi:HEAT repeat protein